MGSECGYAGQGRRGSCVWQAEPRPPGSRRVGVARRLLCEGLENMSEVLIPAPDGSVRGRGWRNFGSETSCETQTPRWVRTFPNATLLCFGKATGMTIPSIRRMKESTCFRSKWLNAALNSGEMYGREWLIGRLVGGRGKDGETDPETHADWSLFTGSSSHASFLSPFPICR